MKNYSSLFQLYRGPETRYHVDNLESGIDYTFRVCPVRLADCGDLFGTISPTLRYRIPSSLDATSKNSSTQSRSNSVDVVDSPTATRTVGLLRNLHRITSICSNRSRPSYQEQAILLVIFFFITTCVFAAILQTWTRSNKEWRYKTFLQYQLVWEKKKKKENEEKSILSIHSVQFIPIKLVRYINKCQMEIEDTTKSKTASSAGSSLRMCITPK